jgi:2-keto-3-deoxy-L-rhamnonate aldolase RhmA
VARLVGITPFVRVADLLYPCVARPLDAGAMGLMLPRSETRAQVERFIDMLRYPPLGSRGSSVPKGHNAYRSEPAHEFAAKANSEVMAIIQIERQAAVEDIDDLLTVPGLDAALMGLNDLALSLGVPADPMDPTVIEAVQHVTTACERHSIPLGVHTGSLEALQYWAERGMRILLHSTAVSMTAAGAQASVAALRGIAASLT